MAKNNKKTDNEKLKLLNNLFRNTKTNDKFKK